MCIDTDLDLPSKAKDTYQTFACLASYFSQIKMKQITLSHMSYISWILYCLRNKQLLWNVPSKTVQTTATSALSRSWKKTPTAIRLSVSKVDVTSFLWCCSQTEGQSDCLLRFLDHTHTDTDTRFRTSPNEWSARRSGRELLQHTINTSVIYTCVHRDWSPRSQEVHSCTTPP